MWAKAIPPSGGDCFGADPAPRNDLQPPSLCRLYKQGDPRGRFASEVTLVLNSGAEISSGLVGGGLSFPQPGWDEAVMEVKFRWLAGHVLEAARVDQLVEMLWRFDEIPDVRELTRLLA